ncbi:hypothetical protein QCA50_016319 [Cerrena zonata]|uniref:Protein kinase domain-containing protein n=1 Tax=Cerrena zonata TaxID=2478898 RepID=A0AAW0FSM3_9APHY
MSANNNSTRRWKGLSGALKAARTIFKPKSNISVPQTLPRPPPLQHQPVSQPPIPPNSPFTRPTPRRQDTISAWNWLSTSTKQQFKSYLEGKADWTPLIVLKGDDAKNALKVMQALNDDDHSLWQKWLGLEKDSCQGKLIHLEVKLAQESGELPEFLFVKTDDVTRDAINGGGCADVYQGNLEGSNVALKRLRFFVNMTDDEKRANTAHFAREALMWIHLKHPNVIELYGIDTEWFHGTPCMVMPWVEETNIRSYMAKNQELLTVEQLNVWIIDVANGLTYLHSRGVIHGDLRGANILMENNVAKLTDFGLSVFEGQLSRVYRSNRGGACHWLAPEILKPELFNVISQRPTKQSDVYSFAMVCYEIYASQRPFNEFNDAQVIEKVADKQRPSKPKAMSDDLFNLTEDCWTHFPTERPEISQVVTRLGEYGM